MRPAIRRRLSYAAGLSVAVHAALLVAIATYAPRLRMPEESAGPPQAVIPILIMPRAPPPAAQPGAKPAPIRLHRRPQPFAPAELPVKPLIAPTAEPTRSAPSPAPKAVAPAEPDAVATNARQALRGVVGCANADVLRLTREEREKCNERLGAGAKQADYLGTGIEAGKASALARAAARKEADMKFRSAPPTPPSAPGRAQFGGSAEDMAKALGNDRPELKIPF